MLWVGTGDGLVGVDLDAMSSRPGPAELKGVQVHRMLRAPQGRTWCVTARGLYQLHLDPATLAAELVAGTREAELGCLAVDAQGNLWAGGRGLLFHYDGRTLSEPFRDTLVGREVSALAVAAGDTLWVGLRGGGLHRLENGSLTPVLPASGEAIPEVNAILAHPNGEMWLGTERGILRWTGREFIRLDRQTGLDHDAVLSLCVDREELVWIATRGGGVYQLRSPYLLTYDVYDGLPHSVVEAVLPRPNGDVVVGTAAGVCRMNPTGQVIQSFRFLGRVAALYADDTGGIWVGGPDGLACFDERQGERLDPPGTRTLRDVIALGPCRLGGVWVCTTSALCRLDGERMEAVPLPTDSGETDLRLNGMYLDPQGVVYLAAQTGVLRLGADGSWSVIPSGRPVHGLATDPRGRTWVGTSQGLMTLESGFCQNFSSRGAPHGKVTDIAFDQEGTMWMATREGVFRFDGTRFATFTKADGLPSNDVRCVTALRRGVLLLGTSLGLALVESDRISPSSASPRVVIAGFRAGGEQYMIGKVGLHVPNWQRNVSFSFEGLGFRQDAQGLRFLSRLVGFEEEWSAPSSESSRSYTNLPWGSYEFQVKAVNVQGLQSDRIAALSFSVGPPVWLNPWFLLACAVGLSTLGGWVVATQRKKHQLQQAAAAATVAKNEFLAKVSHEIRTPLTVILGCSEALSWPPEAPPGFHDAIGAIHRNSRHLLRLINDLLDLSRIEAGHLTIQRIPACVSEILRGVEAIMRASAEQVGLDFRIVYESAIPERIVTDPDRLTQTLINLVGNAIKFTPEGHIYIRVRVEDQTDGRWLVFDVEDTGVGVPADKLDLIFEAFGQVESSTSRKFAGTGLGLAISKSVAERLHGRLSVRSEVGKGSTFTLAMDLAQTGVETVGLETRLLSAADLSAEPAVTAGRDLRPEPEPAPPTLSGHILLAEDAPDISNLMRFQLESAGARVTVVDNGPDAVEQAYDGRFDLILMDIHMPGMDGIAAIEEIRNRGIETPIIVISADSSAERCRKCSRAGAAGFVSKPFQKAPFLMEVARHLNNPLGPAGDDVATPIHPELDLTSPKMAAAVAHFAQTLEQRVAQMETAFADHDLETLARLAHQLKGAGGIGGYMCITEQARRLEESLARKDHPAIRDDLRAFGTLTRRILAGLPT